MTQRIGSSNGSSDQQDRVIDFNQIREQRLQEKRRQTERIFFRNLLSVFSVVDNSKLVPIDLIELSEEGCSFQVPHDPDSRWPKSASEFPIRFYFSPESYFEILVKIQNSRPSIDGHSRYIRYGCLVDKGVQSYPVYQLFVKFLKEYSENSRKDMGDLTVFYL